MHEEMQNENQGTKLSKTYRRGRGVLQREMFGGVERYVLECDVVCRETVGGLRGARRHCKTGSVGSARTFDWLPERTNSCCMSYNWPFM